jgi:endogenous inhibitor of DNA gyrase (YacG/DUF329 family)
VTKDPRCAVCGAAVTPPPPGTKSAFPFCSDRCRMVDLGRWLTGQYRIPGESVEKDEEAPAPPPAE